MEGEEHKGQREIKERSKRVARQERDETHKTVSRPLREEGDSENDSHPFPVTGSSDERPP